MEIEPRGATNRRATGKRGESTMTTTDLQDHLACLLAGAATRRAVSRATSRAVSRAMSDDPACALGAATEGAERADSRTANTNSRR